MRIQKYIKKDVHKIMNEIEMYYKQNQHNLDIYISRSRMLEIRANGQDNIIYSIFSVLMMSIALGMVSSNYVKIIFSIIGIGLLINFIFFRHKYKKSLINFLAIKEKEIIDEKIEGLLKLNDSLKCKEVKEERDLSKENNSELSSNNKENIN